jgi:opacity protein-like surface antigen
MFRISSLLFALIAMLPGRLHAQAPAEPQWDFAVTTGLFEGRPHGDDADSYYGDDWYGAARLGVSVGRYWTRHFKTEVEVMTSTEGMHYAARQVTTSDGTSWPYGVQEHYRLSQGSARAVLQLLDNRWIHPYLLAGITVDVERRHSYAAEQFRYLPGAPGQAGLRELVVREQRTDPDTNTRAGAIVGGGAKLYMSANAFANTAMLVTYARPAKSVSLILGFGLDF